MRSVAPALLPIFRSEHQAGLLTRLFLTDDEIPMTDLARDLGIPLTTLHREIGRLEEAGLLASRRVGRTRLVRAGRTHPAARPLADLLMAVFGPVPVPSSRGEDHAAALREPPPRRRERCVYQLRPAWSPRYEPDVYVPSGLRMLNGPTSGRFDPPVNLYWQPGELDFADRADLELFYSSALTAASTPEQFAQWINREALIAVWNRLSLPSRVRNAWECLHPGLRNEDAEVNDRIRIQDTVLTAIAEHGFALAGGSALIDYDVVSRETDDIDAFCDRWDVDAFNSAHEAILGACRERRWDATTIVNEDFRRQVLVHTGTGEPVTVDIVYYERSREPERRADGGLRLIFDDVVGGKGVAVADSARGRDFDDLAHIVETPGWSLERVENAMRAIKYGDRVDQFRANLGRFRRSEFDEDIRKSGFDPAFCHRILD